jgi:ABC-type amino acid transport substrate-binding protein
VTRLHKRRAFLRNVTVGSAIIGVGVALPGATGAGAQTAPAVAGQKLDAIVKAGTLRMGIFLQYPPLQFRDPQTREPQGLDVDLANLLAKDMGVQPQLMDMDWNALIPGLYDNQYDIILASMVPTPTRALAIDFSDHIEQFNEILMVRSDDSRFNSFDQLNSPNLKITFSTGSVSDYAAHRFFPQAQLLGMDQIPSVLQVAAGQADAVVVEDVFAVPYARDHPELRIIGLDNPLTGEPASIGVLKGQQDLLNYINTWIGYKRARKELQALFDTWGVRSA